MSLDSWEHGCRGSGEHNVPKEDKFFIKPTAFLREECWAEARPPTVQAWVYYAVRLIN